MKYRLTERQKAMLRSLVPGLKDGSMETDWVLAYGDDRIMAVFGLTDPDGSLWQEVWSDVNHADFDVFRKYGFVTLTRTDKYGIDVGYSLDAGLIIDVVENEFEIPEHLRPANIVRGDSYNIGDINNSIGVAIGPNASVSIQSQILDRRDSRELEGLIEQLYEKLSQMSEEESEEAETIAESVRTIIEQVQRDKPNRRMLNMNLEGLRQAAADVQMVAGLGAIANQIAQLIKPLL